MSRRDTEQRLIDWLATDDPASALTRQELDQLADWFDRRGVAALAAPSTRRGRCTQRRLTAAEAARMRNDLALPGTSEPVR